MDFRINALLDFSKYFQQFCWNKKEYSLEFKFLWLLNSLEGKFFVKYYS